MRSLLRVHFYLHYYFIITFITLSLRYLISFNFSYYFCIVKPDVGYMQ